jgi:excinuclease ABC subunit C
MLEEATSVVWVVLASEDEALLQEASLIRSLDPPYNVRLRADSAYPYVCLTAHGTPRLISTHNPPRDALVFGPFPSSSHARLLQEAVSLTTGLRPCRDAVLKTHSKLGHACVLGETGRCAAPCLDATGYQDRVESARRLLSGEFKEAAVTLRARMERASSERAFERAAQLRDALQATERLSARVVPTLETPDVAVLGVASDDIGAVATVLVLSSGVLVASPTFIVDRSLVMDASELTDALIAEHVFASVFSSTLLPPPLIASTGAVTATLLSSLTALRGTKVTHRSPRRGPLTEVLALAEQNATAALLRARRMRASDADARRAELTALQAALELPHVPLRIECLDISHLMGASTTAAFAVLEEGVPRPQKFRSLNVDSGNDDVGSIALAVRRRIEIAREHAARPLQERDPALSVLPHLLLIDGGPAQLKAAFDVVRELEADLPVASLAKRLEEVYLPLQELPLRLELDSPALYVLQRARDAAHTLSLRRSRARRTKTTANSVLDGVPGLGAARRARLMKEVRTLKALRALSVEEYPAFLPEQTRIALHEALHPSDVGEQS